jgi:nucleoside-diphosphate-sugar epimerase
VTPPPYRGVRAAVLGASGFIGRWVAKRLADQGASVSLVVRSRDRATPIFERLKIEGTMVEANLQDPEQVRSLMSTLRPAITFNLIAYGVLANQTDPAEAERINIDLVEWIADALAEVRDNSWHGAALVHTGSALEYGRISGNLAEDGDHQPTSLYGTTKLAGTRMIRTMHERHGLPAVAARLFMVYGAGEPAPRLLPSLIRAADDTAALALSDGTQRRDFTHVDDVADGLLRIGAVVGLSGQAVNLATGKIHTVREFIEIASRVLDIDPARLGFGQRPTPAWEMSHSEVSIDRLRSLTGWAPAITPEEGIRRTQAFVRAGARSGERA